MNLVAVFQVKVGSIVAVVSRARKHLWATAWVARVAAGPAQHMGLGFRVQYKKLVVVQAVGVDLYQHQAEVLVSRSASVSTFS